MDSSQTDRHKLHIKLNSIRHSANLKCVQKLRLKQIQNTNDKNNMHIYIGRSLYGVRAYRCLGVYVNNVCVCVCWYVRYCRRWKHLYCCQMNTCGPLCFDCTHKHMVITWMNSFDCISFWRFLVHFSFRTRHFGTKITSCAMAKFSLKIRLKSQTKCQHFSMAIERF